jgi:hypothetical protein
MICPDQKIWKRPEIRAARELNWSAIRYRERIGHYRAVQDFATAADCSRQADRIRALTGDRLGAIRKRAGRWTRVRNAAVSVVATTLLIDLLVCGLAAPILLLAMITVLTGGLVS